MRVRQAIEALILWFLPPQMREADADTLRRAKLCVIYTITVPLWGPGFVCLLWWIGHPRIAAIIGCGMSLALLPLIALRTTGSLPLAGSAMAAVAALLMVSAAWLEGGLAAPGIMWFPVVPMLALLVGGRRVGIEWAVVMIAVLITFYVVEQVGMPVPLFLAPSHPHLALLRLALSVGAIILFLSLAALFESLKAQALNSLETANEALGRALEQAKAATRAKSDFLATMSHEIRTPLHGVFGMTEIARESDNREEARECIDRARACAETLLSIINDILDFSRVDAGKVTLERTRFDPRDVVDGVLDTLAVDAHHKGLDLVGCVAPDVPTVLEGDPGRLRQILTNLAGNAVKFTEEGAVVITLHAARTDATDTITIEGLVRDTGIGISSEAQASIFEAFMQADTSTTRRFGGTGLGLAITQRLVTLMGGTLTVDSTPAEGATFRFSVEVGKPATQSGPALARPAAVPMLVIAHAGAVGRHVLHTLRDLGAHPSALGLDNPLPTAPPPVTIVDLPDTEAERHALIQRLEAWPERTRTAIVALTPIGPDLRTRAAAARFAAVVSKPLKSRFLLTALAALSARGGLGPQEQQPTFTDQSP